MDKEQLRSDMTDRRQHLSADEVESASAAICINLIKYIDWTDVRSVHCYRAISTLGEVDTKSLIDFISSSHPNIRLDIGPLNPTAPIPQYHYDLIIVPLVACDQSGNRIGMGGGWYDRFLASQPTTITAGLAYQSQVVDQIPTAVHDVALDIVVTELKIYTPSRR